MSAVVTPLKFEVVQWAVAHINNLLSQKGWVLGVKVNAKNTIIDVNLVPVGDALEMGFVAVQKES